MDAPAPPSNGGHRRSSVGETRHRPAAAAPDPHRHVHGARRRRRVGVGPQRRPAGPRPRPRRLAEPAAVGHQRLHDGARRPAPADRRDRRPLGPQAGPRRRPRRCSSAPTSVAGLSPRRRACCSSPASLAGVGGGDDHAGHAVGDHVELPGRAAGPGRRHLVRLRRCRRHPRPVRVVVPDRQLHVAVAVRDAGRCSPASSLAADAARRSATRRERQTGRFDTDRLGAVGARHRRPRARHPRRARAGLDRPADAGRPDRRRRGARSASSSGSCATTSRCSRSACSATAAWPPAR